MLLDGFGPAGILLKYPTLEEFFFSKFHGQTNTKIEFLYIEESALKG